MWAERRIVNVKLAIRIVTAGHSAVQSLNCQNSHPRPPDHRYILHSPPAGERGVGPPCWLHAVRARWRHETTDRPQHELFTCPRCDGKGWVIRATRRALNSLTLTLVTRVPGTDVTSWQNLATFWFNVMLHLEAWTVVQIWSSFRGRYCARLRYARRHVPGEGVFSGFTPGFLAAAWLTAGIWKEAAADSHRYSWICLTALRKNTTHTVAVPDEIRTTGLMNASKQHTNPLGDTVQTGVLAHTDCPSDPYPTIATVATVMLTALSSAKCPFCLSPLVQCRTPSSPRWCTKFTAVCICILGSPSCHGHCVCGCLSAS